MNWLWRSREAGGAEGEGEIVPRRSVLAGGNPPRARWPARRAGCRWAGAERGGGPKTRSALSGCRVRGWALRRADLPWGRSSSRNVTSFTYFFNGETDPAGIKTSYDPFGRLDTVTAAGQTLQSDTYDGFDHLASTTQVNASGGSATTSYTYDSLNRMATQTTGAGTTSFSYLGLSSEVASESDPGSVSKAYDYTPGGARLLQDTAGGTGPAGYGYYSYNAHSDVEAVTGSSDTTTATYGYTAYGSPVPSMFTGADKNNATSSASSTAQPYSAYRFNAMRWDGTSGTYDMGFRNYDPGLNQFTSRDMYDGAAQNAGLSTDPFTGGSYAFGNGNPVSNVEMDGHMACAGNGSTGCLAPGGSTVSAMDGCNGGVNDSSCFAPVPSSPASGSGSGSGNMGSGQCVAFRYAGSCPNASQAENPANIFGGALTGFKDLASAATCAIGSMLGQMKGGMPTGVTASGQFEFANSSANLFAGPCSAHLGDPSTVSYKLGYYGAPLLPGGEGDAGGLAGACLGGESFASGTRVLLASGKAVPIASLKRGDKVLATNTKTGKTSAETVTRVEVNHDHDLYDLRVRTHGRDAVIHTTASHLFWDPYQHQWRPASRLKKGERLKTANAVTVVAVGGTTPKQRDGWMWDLTVPGNDDHDFYVLASSADLPSFADPVLVHNDSCDLSGILGALKNLTRNKQTAGQLIHVDPDGQISTAGNPMVSGNSSMTGSIRSFLRQQGVSGNLAFAAAEHPDAELIWQLRSEMDGIGERDLSMVITNPMGPCDSCAASIPYLLPEGYSLTVYYPGGPGGSMIASDPIQGIGPLP